MFVSARSCDERAPLYLRALHATAFLREKYVIGIAVAFLAPFAAAILRWALDPALPPGFPFLTFFPIVILTTFLFGLWPGTISAILSGLIAWAVFIPPFFSFEINLRTAVAMSFYIFIVAIDILLIHFMQTAAERVRREQERSLELQDQHKVMFQELQHRVANNIHFIAGVLDLQKRKVVASPEIATAILEDARARLKSISRIHRRLYDPDNVRLPIGTYLQGLCDDVVEQSGATHVSCRVTSDPITLDLPRLTAFSLLLVEIVTNAIKHAFPQQAPGTVSVSIRELQSQLIVLTVADDGIGLARGIDPKTSQSIGWRICRALVKQLDASLHVFSEGGLTVTVTLPNRHHAPK